MDVILSAILELIAYGWWAFTAALIYFHLRYGR